MKAVILAGGFGTRITEESITRPKPMVEIGGRPILWHLMKLYSHFGINDFIICCGYKGYVIKEYFSNYFLHMSDVTFNMANGSMEVHNRKAEPWNVTLVDTGEETATGGRLRRVRPYLGDDDFCFTYGDGLSDLSITSLLDFHATHGGDATMTAVRPPGRFGSVEIQGSAITRFVEKPIGDGGWINGGFFVLKPRVIDRIAGDDTSWESHPLESLAREGKLHAYRHQGFWQPMDTLRDKQLLESLWNERRAPWKRWEC
jgi:glucose-1-phosphate cytidylyltransferase